MYVISVHHLAVFKIELVMENKRKKLAISDKLDVIGKAEYHFFILVIFISVIL
jgi:hypothetical protein